jgi:hypothetical protein
MTPYHYADPYHPAAYAPAVPGPWAPAAPYVAPSPAPHDGLPTAAYAPLPPTAPQPSRPLLDFGNDRFVKGLLIGAAAAYLLTNEEVQRTAIKGAVTLWTTLQGGVEEMKERFQDAEAELQAGRADHEG